MLLNCYFISNLTQLVHNFNVTFIFNLFLVLILVRKRRMLGKVETITLENKCFNKRNSASLFEKEDDVRRGFPHSIPTATPIYTSYMFASNWVQGRTGQSGYRAGARRAPISNGRKGPPSLAGNDFP